MKRKIMIIACSFVLITTLFVLITNKTEAATGKGIMQHWDSQTKENLKQKKQSTKAVKSNVAPDTTVDTSNQPTQAAWVCPNNCNGGPCSNVDCPNYTTAWSCPNNCNGGPCSNADCPNYTATWNCPNNCNGGACSNANCPNYVNSSQTPNGGQHHGNDRHNQSNSGRHKSRHH